MLSSLMLVMLFGQVDPSAVDGIVTSTLDEVVITREGQILAGVQGAGVADGDGIHTSHRGGASIFFKSGQVIYLGPDTAIALQKMDDGSHSEPDAEPRWIVRLRQGELRVTADGQTPLTVDTFDSKTRIRRGIVRLAAPAEYESARRHPRVWVEQGHASVEQTGDATVFLTAGQEFRVGQSAQPRPARGQNWQIRIAQYQLASARQSHQLTTARRTTHDALNREYGEGEGKEELYPAVPPAEDEEDTARDEDRNRTPTTADIAALAIGSQSGVANIGGGSGGLFSDANQATLQGMLTEAYNGLPTGSPFPGNIHLITAGSQYKFSQVQLTASEQAGIFSGNNPAYFSVGVGSLPTTQVLTDFFTGTNAVPNAVEIPGFNSYVLRLDQYGIIDPMEDPAGALASNVGLAGLLGNSPPGPTVVGATPLEDGRAEINQKATFALGEFKLSPDGNSLELAIRRSDQDRTIVKASNNNDADDQVTVNSQVGSFSDVADPRFQPAAPTVKVPDANSFTPVPRFADLTTLRRAAVTTLMADQLHDYSRRTGQTRFVIRETDGTQRILDITGFQRP